MFKMRCQVCGGTHTKKNGVRKGVQLYKCKDCGHQFRSGIDVSADDLWIAYQQGKQTISELSACYGMSVSTVKRRLQGVKREWVQPQLSGEGFVHLDVTYWGRGFGVLLALDTQTCMHYPIQMCQFHMKQIIRRYLTQNHKMLSSRELMDLIGRLHRSAEADFKRDYREWKMRWKATINHRSLHKDGRMHYAHQRLRAAVTSLDFYMPYLFTFQREECRGMPNTNNKIEGTFTDLKKNLNNHSGLTMENRRRFISGFFLTLTESLDMEKQKPRR